MVSLKVLVLTSSGRVPDLTAFYRELARYVDLDVRTLDKDCQRNLRGFLRNVRLSDYDRVLLDLNFKHIYKQTSFLKRLEGLLIYEEDACQNYLPHSRWHGKFSKFYRLLPNARVIVTGASVARRLRDEGFDATFIPKGYDPELLFDEGGERDIELGFIGRTASKTYSTRKFFLENLAACEPLQMLRTEPGTPYRQTLNRIRFFVSADIGFGEYMAKNFEAMACGCVLLAWRQGEEELAIGLEEGRHLLLYSSLEELRAHLANLRKNPELADLLSSEGKVLVRNLAAYPTMAKKMSNEICLTRPFSLKPTRVKSVIFKLESLVSSLHHK